MAISETKGNIGLSFCLTAFLFEVSHSQKENLWG